MSDDRLTCNYALEVSLTDECITTLFIIKKASVPNSQNLKNSSIGNKYPRKI